MKKTRRNIVIGTLAAASVPAFAQFGGMLGGGKSSGGGNFDADLKSFLDKSFSIEATASKAALAICSAFASEQKRAEFQTLFTDVGKQTDPKEAGATFQKVQETASAELKKLAESQDLESQTKNLSAEKQKLLAKGVGNFLIGVYKGKDIFSTGQSLMSSATSNPMNLTKAAPVKDALSRLGNAASLAAGAIPKFVKALQGANISVVTASASSKEEDIAEI